MSRLPQPQSRLPQPQSRLPQPQSRLPIGTQKMTKTVRQLPPEHVGTAGAAVAKVVPAATSSKGPSLLQKRVFKEALSKSALIPKKKVIASGAATSLIGRHPTTHTKRGEERILQQISLESTVQRTPRAEYIGKTMTGIDVDPQGVARQIEVTTQEIDPTHATESAGVNATVSVTNTLSVTSGGKQMRKLIKKRTVKSRPSVNIPNMNPAHVSRLVIEEVEDVENTLKMAPPDLISQSVEKFPMRKKVRNMRLNSEAIALLEQSVIYSAPTADEIETEAPPEVAAAVIEAVEKGATPESNPQQVFNTLFPEVKENRMAISSVAPGPFRDIVVPIAPPPHRVTDEQFNEDMNDTIRAIQQAEVLPADDICVESEIQGQERASKAENKKPTTMFLETELPPWETAEVEKISALVGGDPIDDLDATDISIMETSDIVDELSKGVDYFLDADTCPYQTRVQMRGSKLPDWFPGYMSAFPHLPELVKISRSPSGVLHSAWKAVQPKIFPEDSLLSA